ncbi:tRNase Z endonuclease domain-containing protein [Phthorimaea operculella]|nr:tRNase Z endonuclease domain-containing protein [Phthorimaea operculella]
MPKANSQRIAESQRQRQQIAKKSEKYGPSCVYLQVLGSGARGVPNTLYMFTDQKRYLFNCGEQTQRLAHEHKVKLSRLDHIFITSKTWKNIGGLPGLSLTLQDVGVPSITLHGPEGLDDLYTATSRFVIMKDMKVTMAQCSPKEDFQDNVMSVKYVVLGPDDESILPDLKHAAKRPRISEDPDQSFEEFMHDDTDYYRRGDSAGDAKKQSKDPLVKSSTTNANDAKKKRTDNYLNKLQKMTQCTVSYICTLNKRLGTLDLAKCVERGVKPGPLLGQLKSGQDVVLPDGTLVLSKDVKTPDDPGPVFIVLDVPDISYLKEEEFSKHFANGENPPENIPSLIVHYSPPGNTCLGSEAVHRTQHKLHLLDADIFPLLKDVSVPAVWGTVPTAENSPVRLKGMEEVKNKIALAQFQNIIAMAGSHRHPVNDHGDHVELIEGRSLSIFHLRPKKQLDRSAEPKLNIEEYIQETMSMEGFVDSLEKFRRLVDAKRLSNPDSTKEYPKVVFLGTGSCIPSKTRNTSSIVVHVDENSSILLDCSEGTFGQLVRFYGPKRVNAFLRTLKAIYVSHLHADHHIGLIGVLQARRLAFEETNPDYMDPVHLLAPGQIMSWLSLYDQHFEKISQDYTLLPNQSLLMDKDPASGSPDITSAVLAKLGVSNITTCFVPHCPNAFGVAIEIGEHKITYSGDTLPCEKLIKLGQNSTLLIHEATMEDELADEARMKMHSTTSQAIDIGRKMDAKYTVLTHFSQRYARLPRLNANILSAGIAFDNMQAIDIGRKMDAKYTVLTHFSQRYARLPRLNANILSAGIAFDNMQAVDIGRKMDAKYTVLTHFSQRYARLPRLNANILSAGIAFDNMQRYARLPRLNANILSAGIAFDNMQVSHSSVFIRYTVLTHFSQRYARLPRLNANILSAGIAVDNMQVSHSSVFIRYTVLTHFSQRYARLPRLNANILSAGIAFDNMQCSLVYLIDIGRKMDAKYTVLTHFSQRYARLPRLNANILSAGIAFDNMQVSFILSVFILYTVLTHFSQRYARLPRLNANILSAGIAVDNMQVSHSSVFIRYTVLTHFSQRYARLPRLNANILSAGIAFDNMQVSFILSVFILYTVLTHFSQRYARLPRLNANILSAGIAFGNMQVSHLSVFIRYTVLTHFSQRYARLPRLNANILSAGIAVDNMQVSHSSVFIRYTVLTHFSQRYARLPRLNANILSAGIAVDNMQVSHSSVFIRYTVLTHFSQRYARLPRLNANILSAGIAFDNMQVSFILSVFILYTVLTHFSQRYARLPRLNANILSAGIAFGNMQVSHLSVFIRYTVLTHFSQRYARLPRLNANILSAGIAVDNMQVSHSSVFIRYTVLTHFSQRYARLPRLNANILSAGIAVDNMQVSHSSVFIRYTVLTHFSQRYARLPRLNANILSAGIAVDNMQVSHSSVFIRYTVLTHFSQRYARLPRLNANILSAGIAVDNMQVSHSSVFIRYTVLTHFSQRYCRD